VGKSENAAICWICGIRVADSYQREFFSNKRYNGVSNTTGAVMKQSLILSAAFVVGMVVATNSFAQPRPMPPDPYDSQQSTPASQSNTAPWQPALPASNDYPAAEVQAVPAAAARLAAARAIADNSQSALHRLIDQLKEDFEVSADMASALRAEQDAYDHFVAERNRVLQQVASSKEYQTLRDLSDELNEKLVVLNDHPETNRDQIVATAKLRLAYARRLSAMEGEALGADSAVQAARSRFMEAAAKLSDLRASFARSLRRDTKVVAARQQMEDARVDRAAAHAVLVGAIEARDIALDYAWMLHWHDPYTYRYNPSYYDWYGGYPSYLGGFSYTGSNFGNGPFFQGNGFRRGFGMH
jgi:hypothetical protein